MNDFTELIDLASEAVGGAAVAVNDEFFAPKERLISPRAPVFIEDRYTSRGKWMDGWETRRRRQPGHDWAIVRLGLPGVIHGVVVDTTYFKGNAPGECSIDAAEFNEYPPINELVDAGAWMEILRRSPVQPDSRNRFPVVAPARATHVRLNIYPDGGVARLRVHGRAMPDWGRLIRPGCELDLAAVELGGLAIASSDMFFGSRQNLIMPGPPRNMSDGWETRRRRGPGHDWVILQLGRRGSLRRVEVDTTHYKGNAPASCSLEGADAARLSQAELMSPDRTWRTLLAETRLQPHARHFFDIVEDLPVTHVRFNIFPDGGIGRLRVYGVPEV